MAAGTNVEVVVVGGTVVVVVVVVDVVGRSVVVVVVVVVVMVIMGLFVVDVVVVGAVVVVVGRVVVVAGRVVAGGGVVVVGGGSVVVVVVVVGGSSTASLKDPTLAPSVKLNEYDPGVNVVNVNLNVGADPPFTTDPPERPEGETATSLRSVVTLTVTLPPGTIVAEPGLTELISASAGTAMAKITANAMTHSAIERTATVRGLLKARDQIDRTVAPDEVDDLRRIRHSA